MYELSLLAETCSVFSASNKDCTACRPCQPKDRILLLLWLFLDKPDSLLPLGQEKLWIRPLRFSCMALSLEHRHTARQTDLRHRSSCCGWTWRRRHSAVSSSGCFLVGQLLEGAATSFPHGKGRVVLGLELFLETQASIYSFSLSNNFVSHLIPHNKSFPS